MTENKTKEIKIRITSQEKDMLNRIAKDAGLSMSDLIRNTVFGSNKLVCLTEGASIAASIYVIRRDIEHFKMNGALPDLAVKPLLEAVDELSHRIFILSEKLTDIHED
jgi:hypothetical protein